MVIRHNVEIVIDEEKFNKEFENNFTLDELTEKIREYLSVELKDLEDYEFISTKENWIIK